MKHHFSAYFHDVICHSKESISMTFEVFTAVKQTASVWSSRIQTLPSFKKLSPNMKKKKKHQF